MQPWITEKDGFENFVWILTTLLGTSEAPATTVEWVIGKVAVEKTDNDLAVVLDL